MSERKTMLEWEDQGPYESYARAGMFLLNVYETTKGWAARIEVYDAAIALLRRAAPLLPSKEAAQLAAEDALREVLTEALRALKGGAP